MEVIRLTGKPFSEQRADWISVPMHFQLATSGLSLAFCASRTICTRASTPAWNAMFRRGLVEEVRELLQRGLDQNKTAMQAIGYRQVVEHLRGERPLAETIELVKIRTRQFAKRQMTWFRRQAGLQWIPCRSQDTTECLVEQIISARDHKL